MNRADMYRRLHAHSGPWDMLIVGGGATGVGVAIDAATRGYDVLLIEQHDFGKGTSSRSTKLVHGGVRYLEQGNISLVMEALRERGLLLRNAPHLVHDRAFVVPNYDWWEAPFYGLGLKVYNLLAGKYGFGVSRILSKEETLERLPTLKTEGLRGGVVYFDGQFDDTRLLIHMVATAYEKGATLLNYVQATHLTKDGEGIIDGIVAQDTQSGEKLEARAAVVINATGPFADNLRREADPSAAPMIAPSQGIHLVFDRSFLPGESAIMVPHTSDGRVMFAIPWHNHTLIGTTDTPVAQAELEPVAMEQEIEFILSTASLYLARKPARADILSVFAGIRPLVRSGEGGRTAALSRDHTIHIDQSGLLTICGGKWTTYRHMAEDCVNQAAVLANVCAERPCRHTEYLNLHGFHPAAEKFGSLALYGSDAPLIQDLMRADAALAEPLHPALPYTGAGGGVGCSQRDGVYRRRHLGAPHALRCFSIAKAAIAMAPKVAELMAGELGRAATWSRAQVESFTQIARNFVA